MKVFIVFRCACEERDVVGVFSSQQKAEDYEGTSNFAGYDIEVEKHEVD